MAVGTFLSGILLGLNTVYTLEGCHVVHPNFVFTSMVVDMKDKTVKFIKLQNVQLSIEMRVQYCSIDNVEKTLQKFICLIHSLMVDCAS